MVKHMAPTCCTIHASAQQPLFIITYTCTSLYVEADTHTMHSNVPPCMLLCPPHPLPTHALCAPPPPPLRPFQHIYLQCWQPLLEQCHLLVPTGLPYRLSWSCGWWRSSWSSLCVSWGSSCCPTSCWITSSMKRLKGAL